MYNRFGPIVIFKCKFCDWEQESPWVYSPYPPLNMEEYFAWRDMVNGYEEDSRVECVCHRCQELGLELENTKQVPVMEREKDSLDKVLEGVI